MIILSGVIGLNMRGRYGAYVVHTPYGGDQDTDRVYGWPLPFLECETQEDMHRWNGFGDWVEEFYLIPALGINLLAWTYLMVGPVVVSEALIRKADRSEGKDVSCATHG